MQRGENEPTEWQGKRLIKIDGETEKESGWQPVLAFLCMCDSGWWTHLVLREKLRADLSFNDQPQDTLTLNTSILMLTVQISPTNINLRGKGYF